MTIDHIALYTGDLEVMKMFFITYFDAQVNEPYHNPRTGLRTYFLSFDNGTRLEIMQHPDVDLSPLPLNHRGLIHLAFSLGSRQAVDDKATLLQRAGYRVLSGPRITGDGYYEACIQGPEDLQIELTE